MADSPFPHLRAGYPTHRPRRLRQSESFRRLIRETTLSVDQLIMPYFVREGLGCKESIESMPGQFWFSPDTILQEIEELVGLGVRAVLLFGVPDAKDAKASGAWSRDGIVQTSVRGIKKHFKDLMVITDVCLCAYTDHGHCGLVNERGEIVNDASLKILTDVALSHAEAGSDMVAPSDMMDGRIGSIRDALDRRGFENLPILSYAAKFASAFYGPFRDVAHSAPGFGDRKSYQMDPANSKEAIREIASDIQEGADMVMVKPAMAYLDIIREASRTFSFPLAAYSVSGEYAMIKAAAERGWIDEKSVVLEVMLSLARAGARVLITYHAKQIASWLKEADPIQKIFQKL